MITSVIRFGGKKTKKKKRPSWRDFNGHRRLRRVGIIYYNMYIYLSIIGIYIEHNGYGDASKKKVASTRFVVARCARRFPL